eukprot:2687495-Pyramimonas_sp.AAC.1
MSRASKIFATAPDQSLCCKQGELVDFYRSPPNKDASGWSGQAAALKTDAQRGAVTVRYREVEHLEADNGHGLRQAGTR